MPVSFFLSPVATCHELTFLSLLFVPALLVVVRPISCCDVCGLADCTTHRLLRILPLAVPC